MSIDAVVLFGGGIDAGAMVELHWQATGKLGNLHLFYVDYQAKAALGEIRAMNYYSMKYNHLSSTLRLPTWLFPVNAIIEGGKMTSDHKDDYVPGRNMLLAMLAYPFAEKLGAPEIWLGAAPLNGDSPEIVYMRTWALDMQQAWVSSFNAALTAGYGPKGPRLKAPLLRYQQKADYVTQALTTGPELFKKTHSCYQQAEVPCGECAHCLFRENLRLEVGGSL